MVSLAAQRRAQGIEPDAVLGHSEGEITAAYVAGALSLRDAAKVVTLRSKAIRAIAGAGGMVSIARPVERVHALIEPWCRSISVAAQNGPSSTVVTGIATELDDLMAVCERDDVPATRIPVDYAAHSSQVETLRESLRDTLSGLQPRTADIAFISAVTGARLDTSILDGDYWYANLRQPVLFEQAVRWSYEHGYRTFFEASAASDPEYRTSWNHWRSAATTPGRVESTCPPVPFNGRATRWTSLNRLQSLGMATNESLRPHPTAELI